MGIDRIIRNKSIYMELKGFDNIIRNLELSKDQSTVLKGFLKEEAEKLKVQAQATCPYVTGRLQESHHTEVGSANTKDQIGARVIAGDKFVRGKLVNYAAAVHEGSPRNVSKPWLANALAKFGPGFISRLKGKVKFHGGR